MAQFTVKVSLVILVLFGCNDDRGLRILAIGDSNGASEHSWVKQLTAMHPGYEIVNRSVSGNTIGFDNLGRSSLNTIRNAEGYVDTTMDSVGGIDVVLIMLGTNDSKAVFAAQKTQVPDSLNKLIRLLKDETYQRQRREPDVMILSPPPYGDNVKLLDKYSGAGERVDYLNTSFAALADSLGTMFVDTHSLFPEGIDPFSSDGVHLDSTAQRRIAEAVAAQLNEYIQQ